MNAPVIGSLVLMLAVVPAWRTGQNHRGVAELTAALGAADPVARAKAACELREHGDDAAAAIDQLAALLADGSPVDQGVCSRRWWRGDNDHGTTPGEQAAAALVSIGSRTYTALDRALRSTAWIARRNAAWALGALDDPRAVRALTDALRDREASVREQAAWALGVIDQREAGEALIAALKDTDARVRRQAAWALGVLDDARAARPLIDALRDQDAPVREQAAWALGVIERQEAVTPLIAALKDEDARVRRQAAWALGVITK
jgi:HEAT repeat protein